METSRAAELLDSLSGRAEEFETRGPKRRVNSDLIARFMGSRRNSSVGFGADSGADSGVERDRRRVFGIVVAIAVVAIAGVIFIGPKVGRTAPLDETMNQIGAKEVSSVDALLAGSGSETGSTGGSDSKAASTQQGDDGTTGKASGNANDRSAVASIPQPPITVHVAGAVAAPGVVVLPPASRVVDAVVAAGGLRPDADPDRLNLAATLEDGLKVVVPVKGQPLPDEVAVSGSVAGSGGAGHSSGTGVDGAKAAKANAKGASTGSGRVNINTATVDQLQALSGVGPSTAAAIVAKREKDGPFRTVEGLLDVRGIGEVKLEGMRDMVTLG